jgi:hypothetical protein
MQQKFSDESDNHTDLDKFHEHKAQEMFRRFIDNKRVSDFVTAEKSFVAGFLKGVDYGKATYNKKEEYR